MPVWSDLLGSLPDLLGSLPDLLGSLPDLLGSLPVPARLSGAVLVVALMVWVVLQLVATRATRPLPVRAAAASGDLGGDEPPAVVDVLVSDWTVTEDAAVATLIDLAARGHLEFRQPDADPLHTRVHVTDQEAPLAGYEQQMLDRVRRAAVGGSVPLTALTFRDEAEAKTWWRRFSSAVLADARRRQLVRRRVPAWAVALLHLLALVPSAATGWFAWELDHRSDGRALATGVLTFGLLGAVAGRRRGMRGTARGREAAARWLGLRAYLKADQAFAALPPSAVAGWDRYLAYGDALGATPVISAVVDLGMGNRKRVWSSFGGKCRQVRVRYPGPRARYGTTAPRLLLGAVVSSVLGAGLGWLSLRLRPEVDERLPDRASWFVALAVVGLAVVGLLLAARGVYRSMRTLLDLLAPRTLLGEVLWVAPWQRRNRQETCEAVVHYLAVDDGTADRTTAWALPSEVTRGFGPGDVVEIRVRPWSRRVTRLSVAQSRHGHPAHAVRSLDPAGGRPGEPRHDVPPRSPG